MMEEIILCEYGCGQTAKFKLENGKWCCSDDYRHCKTNRKKISKSLKGRIPWNKGKKNPYSEGTILKMKNSQKGRKQGPHSEEHKRKLSISKLGDKNPAKREDVRKRISKTVKKIWDDTSSVYHTKEYWSKRGKTTLPTKPEIYITDLLDVNFKGKFEYVGNYKVWIDGKNPDWIDESRKKIIEYFGGHWHDKEMTGESRIEHELRRILHFKRHGYEVLVLWEEDIKDETNLIEKIRNYDNSNLENVSFDLPDIQHTLEPPVKIPIKQVGVQNVKTSFLLKYLDGSINQIIANTSMSTDLRSDMKGISMSMLIRSLVKFLDSPLNQETVKDVLKVFKVAVESDSNDSFIRFDFSLPIQKKAPISGLEFPQFYNCSFEGRMIGSEFNFYQRVRVPYQSYCPCSASLCNHLEYYGYRGFPHAQRAFADVLIHVTDSEIIFLEEIIELVEKSVVNIMYPILKRVDEQEVARRAAENPMFVEDAIRLISKTLNDEARIKDFLVKCTHEESIHTHEAIAINWKGIPGGFNGLYFL